MGLIGSAFKAGASSSSRSPRRSTRALRVRASRTVEMAPVGGSLLLAARVCGEGDAIAAASSRG